MEDQTLEDKIQLFNLRIIQLNQYVSDSPAASELYRLLLNAAVHTGLNYQVVVRTPHSETALYHLELMQKEIASSKYLLELMASGNLIQRKRVIGLIQNLDEIMTEIILEIESM